MRPNVSSEDSRNKQHPPQGAAAPATDFSLLSSWKSWVEFHTQQGRLLLLSDSWAMCFQDVCEDPDGSLNPGMHGKRKTGKADRQKQSQRRIRVERPGERRLGRCRFDFLWCPAPEPLLNLTIL